jgi:hypothetical protein
MTLKLFYSTFNSFAEEAAHIIFLEVLKKDSTIDFNSKGRACKNTES